jgi:hypothetical protein
MSVTNDRACPICWLELPTNRGVLLHIRNSRDQKHKGWKVWRQ